MSLAKYLYARSKGGFMANIGKKRKKINLKNKCFQKESSAFLRSTKEITVCGCRKVLHYTSDTVRLCLFDGIMEINGEGITVSTYFGNEIKLSGKISALKITDEIEQ